MNVSKCIQVFIALLFIVASPNVALSQTKPRPAAPDVKMQAFIDGLLGRMTIDEKLGQLNLPGAGDITTGQAGNSDIAKKIKEGKVGGLFNIKSVAKIRDVQKIAVEQSRLKIPLLFGMDVIHGYETVFPIPLGLSCKPLKKAHGSQPPKQAPTEYAGPFPRWWILRGIRAGGVSPKAVERIPSSAPRSQKPW
jgi:beta-glucosidase